MEGGMWQPHIQSQIDRYSTDFPTAYFRPIFHHIVILSRGYYWLQPYKSTCSSTLQPRGKMGTDRLGSSPMGALLEAVDFRGTFWYFWNELEVTITTYMRINIGSSLLSIFHTKAFSFARLSSGSAMETSRHAWTCVSNRSELRSVGEARILPKPMVEVSRSKRKKTIAIELKDKSSTG